MIINMHFQIINFGKRYQVKNYEIYSPVNIVQIFSSRLNKLRYKNNQLYNNKQINHKKSGFSSKNTPCNRQTLEKDFCKIKQSQRASCPLNILNNRKMYYSEYLENGTFWLKFEISHQANIRSEEVTRHPRRVVLLAERSFKKNSRGNIFGITRSFSLKIS